MSNTQPPVSITDIIWLLESVVSLAAGLVLKEGSSVVRDVYLFFVTVFTSYNFFLEGIAPPTRVHNQTKTNSSRLGSDNSFVSARGNMETSRNPVVPTALDPSVEVKESASQEGAPQGVEANKTEDPRAPKPPSSSGKGTASSSRRSKKGKGKNSSDHPLRRSERIQNRDPSAVPFYQRLSYNQRPSSSTRRTESAPNSTTGRKAPASRTQKNSKAVPTMESIRTIISNMFGEWTREEANRNVTRMETLKNAITEDLGRRMEQIHLELREDSARRYVTKSEFGAILHRMDTLSENFRDFADNVSTTTRDIPPPVPLNHSRSHQRATTTARYNNLLDQEREDSVEEDALAGTEILCIEITQTWNFYCLVCMQVPEAHWNFSNR